MKAVRLSFFQMAVAMRRDMMLYAACLTPILAGFFFRFAIPILEALLMEHFQIPEVISPYYKLIDIFFAMLSPTMFCFVSAMVSLEEADEKTAGYLFITPLGKTGYLIARFGIPASAALLVTMILLPCFKLTVFSPLSILLFVAAGTLQGVIVALLVLTLSSNRLEGMAVTKLFTLTIFGAAIPFFIKDNIQYVLFILPSFWIGKAACEDTLLYIVPALALSAVWIYFLLKWYLRKI
ncbi:MAG: ABC transporter permease [Coprococcus sp.]|nr:ABC transporter permease [Coprococcus sp.]